MRRRIYGKRHKLNRVPLVLLCVLLALGSAFGLFNCMQQTGAYTSFFGGQKTTPSWDKNRGLAAGQQGAGNASDGGYQIDPGLSIYSSNAILINADDGGCCLTKTAAQRSPRRL